MRSYNPTIIPVHDEGLARKADLGIRAHQVIAKLAARGAQPTYAEQTEAVKAALTGFRPVEKRAHRQNLLSDVHTYFTHLIPPASWLFAGSEDRLGTGRVDLIWTDPDGRILLDEIKTGTPWSLRTTNTQLQVAGYIAAARTRWGRLFVGLRLLSTYDHRESTFIDPALTSSLLDTTAFRR